MLVCAVAAAAAVGQPEAMLGDWALVDADVSGIGCTAATIPPGGSNQLDNPYRVLVPTTDYGNYGSNYKAWQVHYNSIVGQIQRIGESAPLWVWVNVSAGPVPSLKFLDIWLCNDTTTVSGPTSPDNQLFRRCLPTTATLNYPIPCGAHEPYIACLCADSTVYHQATAGTCDDSCHPNACVAAKFSYNVTHPPTPSPIGLPTAAPTQPPTYVNGCAMPTMQNIIDCPTGSAATDLRPTTICQFSVTLAGSPAPPPMVVEYPMSPTLLTCNCTDYGKYLEAYSGGITAFSCTAAWSSVGSTTPATAIAPQMDHCFTVPDTTSYSQCESHKAYKLPRWANCVKSSNCDVGYQCRNNGKYIQCTTEADCVWGEAQDPVSKSPNNCEPIGSTAENWCVYGTYWKDANYTVANEKTKAWTTGNTTADTAIINALEVAVANATHYNESVCVCNQNRMPGWTPEVAMMALPPTLPPVSDTFFPTLATTQPPTAVGQEGQYKVIPMWSYTDSPPSLPGAGVNCTPGYVVGICMTQANNPPSCLIPGVGFTSSAVICNTDPRFIDPINPDPSGGLAWPTPDGTTMLATVQENNYALTTICIRAWGVDCVEIDNTNTYFGGQSQATTVSFAPSFAPSALPSNSQIFYDENWLTSGNPGGLSVVPGGNYKYCRYGYAPTIICTDPNGINCTATKWPDFYGFPNYEDTIQLSCVAIPSFPAPTAPTTHGPTAAPTNAPTTHHPTYAPTALHAGAFPMPLTQSMCDGTSKFWSIGTPPNDIGYLTCDNTTQYPDCKWAEAGINNLCGTSQGNYYNIRDYVNLAEFDCADIDNGNYGICLSNANPGTVLGVYCTTVCAADSSVQACDGTFYSTDDSKFTGGKFHCTFQPTTASLVLPPPPPLPTTAPTTKPSMAPTTIPTIYYPLVNNPDNTVREFWPESDASVEYVWHYTLRGPYLVWTAAGQLEETTTDHDIFWPSTDRCEATAGCRAVSPVHEAFDTAKPYSCVFMCVQFVYSDATEAPLIVRGAMVSNMSQCSFPGGTYMNTAILSTFILSASRPDLLTRVYGVRPTSPIIDALTWTPWMSMTAQWMTENNYDPQHCSGALTTGCIPAMQFYETYDDWYATRDTITKGYLDSISTAPILKLNIPRLYPNFTFGLPSGLPPGYVVTYPTELSYLRQWQLYSLYQIAVMKSANIINGNCLATYTNFAYGILIKESAAPSAPIVSEAGTISIGITQQELINYCTTGHTCTSMGMVHPACSTITDAALCAATPLCMVCEAGTTKAPVPFTTETVPPSPAPPPNPVFDDLDNKPLIGTIAGIIALAIFLGAVMAVLACRRIAKGDDDIDPDEVPLLLTGAM